MSTRTPALFCGLLAAFVIAPSLRAQDAHGAFEQGIQASQNQNWREALADFNQVIQLDPKNADAYTNRGYVKEMTNDIKGALADYSKAISLDPRQYKAYECRGFIKYHQQYDTAGAMADFNQAIALNSTDGNACYDRGNAKLSEGDVDGAIQDLNLAIRNDQNSASAYEWRGYAEFEKTLGNDADPNFKERATNDLQKSIDLNSQDQDYQRFFIWLIEMEVPGQAEQADRELTDYMNVRPGSSNDWEVQIGNFLLNRSSKDYFLKAADQGDKRMAPVRRAEALFYVGMKQLDAGDRAGAASSFKQAIATGPRHGSETDSAQYWLKQNPDNVPNPQ